jgi:hypothetical protein
MRCHLVGRGEHTSGVDPISECILLTPVKICTGGRYHDPTRHPRSLSAGDLHLGGCGRLSKDAGSLILLQPRWPATQSITPMHRSRSHDAVIRVYDDAGNVIETHEHVGDFKGNVKVLLAARSRF